MKKKRCQPNVTEMSKKSKKDSAYTVTVKARAKSEAINLSRNQIEQL